ncbi:hypothetical protein FRC01_010641, partial [Tulasnella sp. 417]
VYRMRDEPSKVEEAYIEARDISSRVESKAVVAQSACALGEVYQSRAEYSKAEESYLQARDIYSQIGDQFGFSHSIRGLGDLYLIRGEFSKAGELYIQARDIGSRIGHDLGLARALRGIGSLHLARGEHEKAQESYLEAQKIYNRTGNPRELADISWERGLLHRKRGQYEEAESLPVAYLNHNYLAMDENNKEKESNLAPSAQAAIMEEFEDATKRLRISPRKVLGSLSHLRIDKARIKPIEDQDTKAGGKADVEAAILAPQQSSNSPTSDGAEYVAVKKLRFDAEADDDRALAPLAHEVNLLNELSHKNVLRIVGFVEDVAGGVVWMVFAWEKNGNLREFIRSAKWELTERISLVSLQFLFKMSSLMKLQIDDVARGLTYLHGRDQPICHGDLKSVCRILPSPELILTWM